MRNLKTTKHYIRSRYIHRPISSRKSHQCNFTMLLPCETRIWNSYGTRPHWINILKHFRVCVDEIYCYIHSDSEFAAIWTVKGEFYYHEETCYYDFFFFWPYLSIAVKLLCSLIEKLSAERKRKPNRVTNTTEIRDCNLPYED